MYTKGKNFPGVISSDRSPADVVRAIRQNFQSDNRKNLGINSNCRFPSWFTSMTFVNSVSSRNRHENSTQTMSNMRHVGLIATGRLDCNNCQTLICVTTIVFGINFFLCNQVLQDLLDNSDKKQEVFV